MHFGVSSLKDEQKSAQRLRGIRRRVDKETVKAGAYLEGLWGPGSSGVTKGGPKKKEKRKEKKQKERKKERKKEEKKGKRQKKMKERGVQERKNKGKST